MLLIDNVCHAFDGKTIFRDLSLSVAQGQVVAIVGRSGVGKTTLFNVTAGLIAPSVGKIWIDGVDRTGLSGFVGYMQQKDLLLPFKTVYDNIALPLILRRMDKDAIQAHIDQYACDFGLQDLLDKYPHTLSGGQRQRVALLRTYLCNSRLMLLDEPFSALDYVTKLQMHAWFSTFSKARGLSCLVITHDVDEALALADWVYVLKGEVASFVAKFAIPKDDDKALVDTKHQILQILCHEAILKNNVEVLG